MTGLPHIITSRRNEKLQFKVDLNNFLCAHSFYSVDEFFACTDDICEMLPLETKQSGDKLLPHSDLQGRECF